MPKYGRKNLGELSLFLEVPDRVSRKDVSDFLEPFKFVITCEEPISCSEGEVVYVVKGPGTEYQKLEDAVKKGKYKIWSNPVIEPFRPLE